jgi:hypothetical protein
MDFPQSRFQVREDLRTHLTSAHLRKNILAAFRFFELHTAKVKTGKARIEHSALPPRPDNRV